MPLVRRIQIHFAGLSSAAVLFLHPRPSSAQADIFIDEVRITQNVILYKTGRTNAYPNMISVRTDKGLVVFDTHAMPEIARRIREMMQERFGSSVVLVINTHAWYDHTNGNVVFKDVPIIGHDSTTGELTLQVAMASNKAEMGESLKRLEEFKATYRGDPIAVEEAIDVQKAMDLINVNGVVPPQVRFSDELTLSMGSTTLKLQYNTPSYSTSDIIIEIPEEKTLIMGDIFNTGRLPWLSDATDHKAMNALFAPFLTDSSRIEHFVGTHGYLMERSEVKEQMDYIHELRTEVARLVGSGRTMEEAVEALGDLKTFKYLSTYDPLFNGTGLDMHKMNIRMLYRQSVLPTHKR